MSGQGMQTSFIFIAFLGLACCSSAENPDSALKVEYPWQAAIASKPAKTVTDYFLLLPASILDCEKISSGFPTLESRVKLVKVSDPKNGYLQFFKTAQIAVFKNRQDKTDIIAIQSGQSGAGNTCGAVNNLFAYESKTGKWIPKDDLLPKGFNHIELYNKLSKRDILPYFSLPQKGVELVIKDENTDSAIAVLKWNGKAFEIKK